ncbi:MAG: tetratricopeptide repeat protein [Planctomycetota bacterium]
MKKAKRHDTESVCLFPGWAVKFFGILTFAAFVIPGCNGDSGGSQGGRQNPPPLTGVKGETPPPQTKPGELTGEEVQRRRLEAALNEELGQVYIRYSRFAEAIEVYQKAIQALKGFEENAVYHVGLAQAYRGAGNLRDAAKNLEIGAAIYQKVLERPDLKDEQKEQIYTQICFIYRELGKRSEAIKWAEKIVKDGTNPLEIVQLARLYASLGEKPMAIDNYKMAMKKLGDTPNGLKIKLEFADFLVQDKNMATARTYAEEVVQKTKDKETRLAAKRALVRIYDALGILDRVDLTPPKEDPGEKKE